MSPARLPLPPPPPPVPAVLRLVQMVMLVRWRPRRAGARGQADRPVVLLVPTWTSEIPPDDREALVERLELRPFMLVQWKQMGRSWRRRGFRAARGALRREMELLEELSRKRALGFQVISGVKWPHVRRA